MILAVEMIHRAGHSRRMSPRGVAATDLLFQYPASCGSSSRESLSRFCP